ncbi:hypothetical protein SPOG_00228 [Schizosaccharomyces cryophilus OY26]|uniref:Uncharacterized protein n=1 Tax=Schizosaccharomyces cryophilus (strain OY26 / ATCC MYA-4695 / CBS 11777 / NBRC 106824 / NRRL Y48691) TaxID=653667 RepID=S9W148_SCHCR|nr:uncharacterized protein SPOG_00228 [Schizosaccharomyces cryophilus OY26]EPY51805.1 hypothetical protein SPOG_00228 [Schizosaccharomyces cryophilus OY26]
MIESKGKSKIPSHLSKGKEEDRQSAQLSDYDVYPKIQNMSFQRLDKENPNYLKKFQCNVSPRSTTGENSAETIKSVPNNFSLFGMVKSMFNTVGCCLLGQYEEEAWDEFVDESVAYKKYDLTSTGEIKLPSFPVREVPYFQHNVPYDGYLSPLSYQGWIRHLSQNAGVEVSWKKTYCTVMNPFSNGMIYTIPHNDGRILLESCYCEKNLGMSTSPRIMEFMPYRPLVKFNCSKLFNSFENYFRELTEFLLNGRAPLNVLVHHIMLYHYYPTSMKDVLWKAVEVYLDIHCTEDRYCRVQVEAAKRRLGDIRLYLVYPRDIYKFTNSKDWIAVATRGFMSYIQTRNPLCLGSIPVNNKSISELLSYTTSTDCMAWLSLLICAGSNGSRFPLHKYINTKTRIMKSKTSITDFLFSDEDLLFFQDKESITEFKPLQQQLLRELADCDAHTQALHDSSITRAVDASKHQMKGIKFYEQEKTIEETKETHGELQSKRQQLTKQLEPRQPQSQINRISSYSSTITQKGYLTPLLITRVFVQ